MTANAVYDVAVIGAGVVGSAIARDLAGHQMAIALVEARADVGDATSKANTAILHTGFDATPGTLESELVRRGWNLWSDYAASTGVPVEKTGALLVAWSDEEVDTLPALREKAATNGYHHCQIVGADEVYRQVPALGPGALAGLTVPDESITCTWTATLALATDAKRRGVDILLGREVTAVETAGPTTTIRRDGGDVVARWVVNAAGLGSDRLDGLFGFDRFRVTPRRGELLVFDKLARPMVNRIVLPVPSKVGKGVLVSPTIYGNVMLGPTAEDLEDRGATNTTESGFEFLMDKGRRIMPRLLDEEVTASYAGLRASIGSGDYLIDVDAAARYVLIAGIRSTGLTASMAIAEHVRGLLVGAGLDLIPRPDLPAPPLMPNLGEAFVRPYQDPDLIARDAAYGRLICFCERVSEGEIRDAMQSTIPPSDVAGLRRRTRALNGRCQGFFCGAEIERLMETQRRPAQTEGW
jgi:glycerol-3-phosphate dehydrogenase